MKESENSRQEYESEIEAPLARLASETQVIHVPALQDPFRRKSRSHFHSTPEMFIQTGGATDFECPGGSFRLGTGEICVMPRGLPHAETPKDLRTPYRILVLTQVKEGMILLRCHSGPTRRIHGLDSIEISGHRGRDSFRLLDEIASSGELPGEIRPRYLCSLTQSFLLTALAELRRSATPSGGATKGSALVLEAEKLARTSLANPQLKVAWLAGSLGCSSDHLSRLFHKDRGINLATWIAKERIQMAKDLLKESRYNISEVGWACGFNGASYFIKVFQRHAGITPRTYRLTASKI